MSKSASGNLNNPERNVASKSGLNRSILDQSWFEFRRQLEYKQVWSGGELIAVKPHYTSQECNKRHNFCKENRTQATFKHLFCGFSANADALTSAFALAAGHAVLVCGEAAQSGTLMKPKPTASTIHEIPHT